VKITDKKYFPVYHEHIGYDITKLIEKFNFFEKQIDINYFTQASAVYSSNIEGNSIDLNSYMNYKLSREKFKPMKEVKEIEHLIAAYQYAQKNNLNEDNFLECHRMFSKTLLIKSKRGKYRNDRVGVFGESGLVYLAIEPEFVEKRMKEFFMNISSLLANNYSTEEIFYFASLIHLIFAHIHPFMDGNGRAARILEKWFLAEKLGSKFWKIPSEKYYKDNQEQYYTNLNLGINYYELVYDNCLPFLIMLSSSLK
jgi:Fic family protein